MTEIRTIFEKGLVWDDHCGFSLQPGSALEPLLRPWRDAGVGYLSINIYYDPQPWTNAVENIAILRRRLPDEVPYCQVVSTVDEIDLVRAQGGMAVTFDIEGMNALDGRLELVQLYYDPDVDAAQGAQAHSGIMLDRNAYYWPAGCGYERPAQCLDVRRLPEVADELAKLGFDSGEITAVLGGNFHRIAEQVWT